MGNLIVAPPREIGRDPIHTLTRWRREAPQLPDVEAVRKRIDMVSLAKLWAGKFGEKESEVQRQALAARLTLERRLGELLAGTVSPGKRWKDIVVGDDNKSLPEGTTRDASSAAQTLAVTPQKWFDKVVEEVVAGVRRLPAGGVVGVLPVLGIGDSGWDRRARPSPAMPRQPGPKTLRDLRTSPPHRNQGTTVGSGCNRLLAQSQRGPAAAGRFFGLPGRGRSRLVGAGSMPLMSMSRGLGLPSRAATASSAADSSGFLGCGFLAIICPSPLAPPLLHIGIARFGCSSGLPSRQGRIQCGRDGLLQRRSRLASRRTVGLRAGRLDCGYTGCGKTLPCCHPERSEGPLYLNFQANTEVLRRLRLLRMTV